VLVEAGQFEVEIEAPQFFEFGTKKLEVPIGLLVAAIVHQPVSFDLGWRQVIGDMDRHLLESQLLRRQQPRVPADDDAVLIYDDCLPQPNSLMLAATLSIARSGIFRLFRE
jgi:hypothetical protein